VEGFGEDAHLGAGVVDVVLALDVVAGGCEDAGEGVAKDGAAAVADLQGAGGVGGDELDLQLLSVADVDGAPGVGVGEDVVDLFALPVRGETQVDEARGGDFNGVDEGAGLDGVGDGLGDVEGFAFDGAGEAEATLLA